MHNEPFPLLFVLNLAPHQLHLGSAVLVVDNTAHSCFLITIIIAIIIFLDNFPQLRSHSLLNCFFYRRYFPFQIILQAFLGTFSNSNINFLAEADVNCIFFKL